jgi:hypothetical protein
LCGYNYFVGDRRPYACFLALFAAPHSEAHIRCSFVQTVEIAQVSTFYGKILISRDGTCCHRQNERMAEASSPGFSRKIKWPELVQWSLRRGSDSPNR